MAERPSRTLFVLSLVLAALAAPAWAQNPSAVEPETPAGAPSAEPAIPAPIRAKILEVLRKHSEVRSLLTNPRVKIVIDDGRRWLNRHPERRFDLIVSNTSQHWRAHATHLLSQEFLAIVRHHLEPDGVYYFNTTYSHAALKTAMSAFAHGALVINFAAVGDSLHFDRERFRRVLANYAIDGHPLFEEVRPPVGPVRGIQVEAVFEANADLAGAVPLRVLQRAHDGVELGEEPLGLGQPEGALAVVDDDAPAAHARPRQGRARAEDELPQALPHVRRCAGAGR